MPSPSRETVAGSRYIKLEVFSVQVFQDLKEETFDFKSEQLLIPRVSLSFNNRRGGSPNGAVANRTLHLVGIFST